MPRGDGAGPIGGGGAGPGRGAGRGMGKGAGRMGGARAGAGPGGNCICPHCGEKVVDGGFGSIAHGHLPALRGESGSHCRSALLYLDLSQVRHAHGQGVKTER